MPKLVPTICSISESRVVYMYFLDSPMLCTDTVWRFLWNEILAFNMTKVRRGKEIEFRRLPLSFTATGLLKVTSWIYRTFGIQIDSGNNNDRKSIFHCVLCDSENIGYRPVVVKPITLYVIPLHKPKGYLTHPYISWSIIVSSGVGRSQWCLQVSFMLRNSFAEPVVNITATAATYSISYHHTR
jgi:hypothetical protein